jgi:hypothetical protein
LGWRQAAALAGGTGNVRLLNVLERHLSVSGQLLQTLAQQGDTRSCSGPLAGKDFGAQLVVSLIGKPL